MESGSSSDAEEDLTRVKIVVLGNGSVGKTSLIQSFCRGSPTNPTGDGACSGAGLTSSSPAPAVERAVNRGSFDAAGNWRGQYKQTVGVDFYAKRITFPSGYRESSGSGTDTKDSITLHLWDVGGQQLGGSMLAHYLFDADAICLVFDVSNINSFKDLDDWLTCVEEALQTGDRGVGSSPAAPVQDGSPQGSTSASHSLPTGKDGSGSCSCSCKDSLAAVLSSVTRASQRAPSSPQPTRGRGGRPVIALVGTKSDLPPNTHAVDVAERQRFQREHRVDECFLVSARTGDRVPALFLKLTANVLGHTVRSKDLEDFGFVPSTTACGAARRSAGSVGIKPHVNADDCTIM